MTSVIFIMIAWLGSNPTLAQAQPESKPCPALKQLSTWTDSWQAITFKFQQISTMPGMDFEQSACGQVSIVKPWIRWDYHEPEPYTIITDSRRVWMIMPEDHQVITDLLDGFQLERIPILFLQDVQSLLRNYECPAESAPSGLDQKVELTRTNPELNVLKISITLDSQGKPTEVGFVMVDDARNRFYTTQYTHDQDLKKKALAVIIPADYSISNFQGDQLTREVLNPLRELE